MSKYIEFVTQNLSPKKYQKKGSDGFTGKFYQQCKEITSVFLKFIKKKKSEEETTLPNSFFNASIILIPKLDIDSRRKEKYRLMSLMEQRRKNFQHNARKLY
jgi:hypothetical protein